MSVVDEFKIDVNEIFSDDFMVKEIEERIAQGEDVPVSDRVWLANYKAPEKGDGSEKEWEVAYRAYWAEQDPLLITDEARKAAFALTDEAFTALLETHEDLAETMRELKVILTYGHNTVATDNKDAIYINPEFIVTLKPKEVKHCMGFLAWSIKEDTIARRPEGADFKRWEAACNLLANRYLIDEHVGRLPTNALFMVGYDHETMTIEQVYEHLMSFDLDDLYMNAWPQMVRQGQLIEGEAKRIG